MKAPFALTTVGMAWALSACTYVNPCGAGSTSNPTCPPQSSSSSSSGASSSSSSSSGSSSSGSGSASQAGFSIAGATYFDDFHQANTSAGNPVSATQPMRGTSRRIGAAGVWRAIDTGQAPDTSIVLGISPGNDAGGNIAQMEISRSGWHYDERLANGALLPVAHGDFTPALSEGTEYWFDLSVAPDNRTVTITVPGETRSLEDPNIASLLGNQAIWQERPAQSPPGNVFDFIAVWATEDGQQALPAARSTSPITHEPLAALLQVEIR